MAYYSEELIDEVISQNDIVEVISEYVTLKKSGRNFMGLCPFHREKSPSFSVSMDKQIFKCFGCSEGGNVISFIMKIENLDFWDSVELLAQRAHIDLSKYEVKTYSSNKDSMKKDLKETLYKLHKDAAIYFNESLMNKLNGGNNIVKEYIEKRKLNANTLTKFGIGYSNEERPLYIYLKEKGYSDEEIFASGIVIQNENRKPYNRFSSRLIFPIFDIRDRVIGFGGRVLDKSLPKYVNSPESEIYSKGKNLYALNFAKKEKTDSILVVEGYMDSVSLHKNGVNNVVASLGTALTESQARLLKKYTDTVIVGYDQDSAGQEATMRGLDILMAQNLNVKVLKFDRDDVKDPDEYINKYGVERFRNCLESSMSLVEFKISKIESALNIDNLDSKIKFLNASADIIAKIENNIEREVYVDRISGNYKISKGALQNEVNKRIDKGHIINNSFVVDNQVISKKMYTGANVKKRQEQYIVALLMSKDKNIQKQIAENIYSSIFQDERVKNVYIKLTQIMSEYDINKIDVISKIKDEQIVKDLTEIMYLDISDNRQKLLDDIIRSKKKDMFLARRDEIVNKIKQNITKDEQEVLQFELNQIILELSKLKDNN